MKEKVLLEKARKITFGFFIGGILMSLVAIFGGEGVFEKIMPFYRKIAYGPLIIDDSMERAARALCFIGGVGLATTGGMAYFACVYAIRKIKLPKLPERE
jgi:hypothetical protein